MVGFEIFLDVVAVCFVFLLIGRDRNAPAVEVEVEATPPETEVAIATVPDVDLPFIGELFAEADEVGDHYLAPSEIAEREAARAAIAPVFTDVPPHQPSGGRRVRIEALFEQVTELRERAVTSDALLLTVTQGAVDRLGTR